MKYTCKLLVIIIIYFFSSNNCLGQATGDNFPVAGKFLGYNGAGIDLDFRTNNIDRMRLMETGTNTVDGYFYDNSGFLGISQDPAFFTSQEPFSLLHLNGNNVSFPTQGYRDWMTAGITFTHNSDMMYVGPKSNGIDVTDLVKLVKIKFLSRCRNNLNDIGY